MPTSKYVMVDTRTMRRRFPGQYDDVAESHVRVDVDVFRGMVSARPPAPDGVAGKQDADHPQPAGGPGTELKALLKDWLGIQATPNCSCNSRARQMDEWGPDLCEQNMPTILDWLAEQAKSRSLPFVRIAAEQVVRLAIRRARRKASK